jgi:hypothetical protein
MNASAIGPTTFNDLISNIEDEFDWPQLSWVRCE